MTIKHSSIKSSFIKTASSLFAGGVVFGLLLSNSFADDADAELKAVMLGEFSENAIDVTQMKPMAVLALLKQNSSQNIAFSFQQMSMPRGWLEITKIDNACMYNKVKTEKRQKIAYYSQYPITLYPPLRLIVRAADADKYSAGFDLSTIEPQQYMRYAVAKSRSYGKMLDIQISAQKELLFFRDGANSVGKLVDMLALNRIDGFIEYADSVNTHITENKINFDFKSIAIKGIDKPSPGYIVCSKTDYGKKLIDAIDQAMSRKPFQNELISIHNDFASIDDKSLLTSELISIFGQPE
ncbi:hypothetical protein [Shewanella glacialimarina]|uniref:hypothetical protein n=1 Tax=Shewanella glacialimarina TaxID=2590884 RepID=UPI001CF92B16|nr:hypothetical protein [Shewanella glacialimarina]UCX05474.1 hypothetical protein FJ709_13860 [Shewanella glacialimarina]